MTLAIATGVGGLAGLSTSILWNTFKFRDLTTVTLFFQEDGSLDIFKSVNTASKTVYTAFFRGAVLGTVLGSVVVIVTLVAYNRLSKKDLHPKNDLK